MADAAQPLRDFKPRHDYMIAIDSDGCAFDTMEIKHKECFIPNIINEWELQAVSKYAREAAEFVNLYSKWRGVNRFPALLRVFDLLDERPEVQRRGVKMPEVPSLRQWAETESKLGNPALQEAVERTDDPILRKALKWSMAVNDTVARIVRGVPPFPFVRDNLEKAAPRADMIVVSATPCEALEREWQEHDIAKYVEVIAGQEMGKKGDHLQLAAEPNYPPERILMVGDAPGDMKAARAVDGLFYPINPGQEEKSWEQFYGEALERFLEGTYAGDYEAALIEEFESYLPETPPWKVEG